MVILHIEGNRQLSEDLQRVLEGTDADLYQAPGIAAALTTLEVLDHLDVLLVGPAYAASIDTLRSALPLDPSPRLALLHPSSLSAAASSPPPQTAAISIDQPEQVLRFIHGEAAAPEHAAGSNTGLEFGDYQLRESLDLSDTTETYRAHQKSIDRLVTLELLKPEYLQDPEVVREFRAMVRAKAALVHPHVIPVYDAMETDGMLYYTTEYVQGMPLPYFVETGQTLSEKNLVQLIVTVAETMSYLHREKILHRPLQAADVFLDQSRQPHISNLAVALGAMPEQPAEITSFVSALRPLATRGRALSLLQRMGSSVTTWNEVLDYTNRYQEELRNFSAYQRTETEGLVVAPLERKRRRRRFIITGLLAAAGLGVLMLPRKAKAPRAREFSQMFRVRPGEFVFQDNETLDLSGFWMSEYEVTIAQYAQFLAEVESDRNSFTLVAHPSQPPSKTSFRPTDWDTFHMAARQGGLYRGQRIDVNCPVFNVDWWDANAYARWIGHRLPTEQEWEKAARGEQGFNFPWGSDSLPDAANMASEDNPNRPEGYGYWTPVDHFFGDTTPTGIKGLAGNVEEWTESVVQHPDYPDRQVPVVRGGSFATPHTHDLRNRRAAESFEDASINRGFRTVSDTAPV